MVAGAPSSPTPVRLVATAAFCLGLGASLGFIPGFIATTLRDDLGISRGQVGLLVSLHFGCTGIGSIVGGRLTETFGARLVIVADMVIVAVAAAFGAIVGSYWALLVVAVFAGAAYALSNAGTNVAIGRAVATEQRTMAMSVKTAGVPLMGVVAAGAGPYAAAEYGWRSILAVTAILAVIAAAIAATTFQNDRPAKTARREIAELPERFLWFPIGAFLLIAGSQPLYSWTVAYLEQSLDASPVLAGGISAGASACGVVIMIASARLADREGPAERLRRLIMLIVVNVVSTVMVLAGEWIGVGFVAFGAIVGIGSQLAAIGTMHAAVVDRAPLAVARATGITMTGYYIGALVSPAAFGALVDATDTFAWSWGATAALLVLAIPAWMLAGRGTTKPSDRAALTPT